MITTLLKSVSLIAIIALGYTLKRIHLFNKNDFQTISKIILYLSLPCAIISKLNGLRFSYQLLWLSLLAFLFNVVLIIVAYFCSHNTKQKQFNIVNLSGLNIGNFTLPFISYFMGPNAVLLTCLLDSGNSIISLGGNFAIAKTLSDKSDQNILIQITSRIFKSVPILSYLIMFLLSFLQISLSEQFISITTLIGSSNTFLSMLMIGIVLEFVLSRKQIKTIIKILFLRYAISFLFSLFVYYLLPFSLDIKQVIIIVLFSPIAGMACLYTSQLKNDSGLSATLNSLSIIISILIMSVLIVCFQ